MDITLLEPFHVDHTLNSGQVFRWSKSGYTWEGIVNNKKIKITQNDSIHYNCSKEFLINYFRLDENLDIILSKIDKDPHIHKIINTVYGLRLVRQDPWECLISFICSSFNNVPRIKQIIEKLCTKFGEKVDHGYTFPRPHVLARASLPQLRACGLGYRDTYVQKTARLIDDGLDLHHLREMSYEPAKKILMELPGVGHKVADCVLLFSLEKLEAFPCDVNIKKCVTALYGPCSNVQEFGRTYFNEYAGYANHYLFHYHRLYGTR
ncbi:MAG: DNA glycosylase [Candidatus Methanofastidiosia archaeon]|jgi:N-glycosylase/DNA lyase